MPKSYQQCTERSINPFTAQCIERQASRDEKSNAAGADVGDTISVLSWNPRSKSSIVVLASEHIKHSKKVADAKERYEKADKEQPLKSYRAASRACIYKSKCSGGGPCASCQKPVIHGRCDPLQNADVNPGGPSQGLPL